MQRPPRPHSLGDVFDRLDKFEAEILALQEQIGALTAEMSAQRRSSEGRVIPPPLPPFRDPDSSVHDFDEDVARFREQLRMTARRDSTRARQIAVEAVKTAERDDKAARWDKLVQTGWRVLVGVVVGVVVTVILYRFGVR